MVTRRSRFDGLIIATGAAPKHIGDHRPHPHVHVLRTLDDAMRVRSAIAPGGQRVVVIGAGFIGLEVAATARQLGNDVVVLEGGPAPLIRGLGDEMGAAIGAMHVARGIDLRCGVAVDGFVAGGVTVRSMAGTDAEVVPADVIVVGVGVAPSVGWLETSGLELRDGIVCDEFLRAVVPPDVASIGGRPCSPPATSRAGRIRCSVTRCGWSTGRTRPSRARTRRPTCWRWRRVNPCNRTRRSRSSGATSSNTASSSSAMPCRATKSGWSPVPSTDGKFLALYGSGGRLHGALGVNAPRWVMPTRKLLLEQMPWDEALVAAVPPS